MSPPVFGVAITFAALAPNLALELVALLFVGWRQRLVHVDGQLDAAADRRPGDARPRDVAVVRRLPGIDPDRRPDRRLVDGGAGARAGLGLGAITCFVVALAGLAALRGLPAVAV